MKLAPSAELGLGVLAVSTAAVLIKACSVPPLGIAAWRLSMAAGGLVLLCALRRHDPLQPFARRDLVLACCAGLFLGLHFASWIASLSLTTVASSVVLVTTTPLWVGLGSLLFLREPPGRALWQGLALALAGSAVVALADRSPAGHAPAPLLGDALALLGALAACVYFLLGRRIQRGVDTLSYVTVVYGVGALVLLAMAGLAGTPLAGYAPRDWALLVLLAAVPQALGHTLLNRSLRRFPASLVAVALLGEPVGASALAWFALAEPVTGWQAAGAALILGGVARASQAQAGAGNPRSDQGTGGSPS